MHATTFKSLALTALATALLCALAPAPTLAAVPAAGQMQVTRDNVTRTTLANGLQVVIIRDTLAPMVTTRISYRVGGYQSPADQPGTAHALEHMLFRNSRGLSAAQFADMGGKMGARHNAVTTSDSTQYFFTAPSQYVDLLLRIEAIRMRGALLDDAEWRSERDAIDQEVSRNTSNPETLAFAEVRQRMFAGSGYEQIPLGSRETFSKTTSTDLRRFYDRWYHPNNALLVIAGDVDAKAVLAKVEQLFGGIPRGDVPQPEPLRLQPFQPATVARSTPAAIGMVRFMYRLPGRSSPDYPAVRVLLQALNNSRSALAALTVAGAVQGTGAGTQSYRQASIGSISAGFAKGKDSGAVIAALDRVLADVREHGVPAELVEAVKRREQAGFEFDKNSAAGLASQWADALLVSEADSPQDELARMLAVTPDDVARVAREYFGPQQRITMLLTPDAAGKRPQGDNATIAKADDDAGSDRESVADGEADDQDDNEAMAATAIADAQDVTLPDWAAKPLADLRLPNWTLDPVRMQLGNGITLIVQPETISKTVVVRGLVANTPALQVPKAKRGVEWMLDDLFRDGTRTLDRTAFRKAQDALAVTVKAGRSFSLAAPSDAFDRGMQLLAENLLQPALPEAAFRIKQRALANAMQGAADTPSAKRKKATRAALLPAGDPSLDVATVDTIRGLALADVKAYHAQVFRPDMTTLVVVGNVTPAQAKATVEKWFGNWQARGPKPEVVLPPVPLNPPSFTLVENPYAAQDKVSLAQIIDIDSANPARHALQLGNLVLGGNGFASRLMQDIRVKHGYAYGVGSSLRIDRSRSHFFINYGSDPDKVAAVDALLQENLQRMRSTPVGVEELLKAKQAAIRSIPLQVSSINGIAKALLAWSSQGEPLDKPMVAARHYLALNAEQVRAAFEQYIHPERLVQVVQGPTPTGHPKLTTNAQARGH